MEWNRIMYPGAQGSTTGVRRPWYEDNGILDIFPNMTLSANPNNDSNDIVTITTPFNDNIIIQIDNMNAAYNVSEKPGINGRMPIKIIARSGSSIEGNENSVFVRDSSNVTTKLCFDTFTDSLNNKHLRVGYENVTATTPCTGVFSGKCLNLNTNREEDYYFMWKSPHGNTVGNNTAMTWGWTLLSNAANLKVGYSFNRGTLPLLLNTHGMTGEIEGYIITRVITQGRVFPFYTIEGTNLIDPYEEFILDGKRWYSLPFGIVIPLSN